MNYSLEQLKAMAYDSLVQIERHQASLKEINNAITNFKVEEIKEEKPKAK